VSRYQKKHSPNHHPDHHPVFMNFFHLSRSIAYSLFKLRAWQSFCTTSHCDLFGLPLGLEPSTSYSIHFLAQSVSSFRSTCPYHRNVFCCSISIILSISSLPLNSLLGTLSLAEPCGEIRELRFDPGSVKHFVEMHGYGNCISRTSVVGPSWCLQGTLIVVA